MAWIAQGRKLAHSAYTSWLYCRTKQRKKIEQMMGKLPAERTTFGSQTFAAVNIDLFGHYKCKAMVNSRAHMKTWPLLVVCQATGAIHVELLHVAVSETESPDTWNWGEVEAKATRKKTVWQFVPPGAQWRNGLAERRVALKHFLRKPWIMCYQHICWARSLT